MTTLNEQFLADLDELSDGEQEDIKDEQMLEQDMDQQLGQQNDDLLQQAKLVTNDNYQKVLTQVVKLTTKIEANGEAAIREEGLSEDQHYQLVLECNKYVVDIDSEINTVHSYIRDKYRLKFPELETLVQHPIDYAVVVKRIGNSEDITTVDLEDFLPSATIMVVSVTASTTSGKPLTPTQLQQTIDACDLAIQLNEDRKLLVTYVQSQMDRLAPNVSELLGSEIAAKLLGLAGGLEALSRIPGCNILVLGAKRKLSAGFSNASVHPHEGTIYSSEIVSHNTPPELRVKVAREISNKIALLARIDSIGSSKQGEHGKRFREDILKKIEKWSEPPPAKTAKPLPVPDAEPKKRRGGKRYRKLKEKYAITEVQKNINRVNFNIPEEEFLDNDEVVGLGVLGKEGTGKLRTEITRTQNIRVNNANKQQVQRQIKSRNMGSSGATGGLSSTIAFSNVQGIELENPNAKQNQYDWGDKKDGTESYFSELGGFRSIVPSSRIR